MALSAGVSPSAEQQQQHFCGPQHREVWVRTVQASTAALAPAVAEQMHTDVSGPAVAAIGCSTGIGDAAAAVTAALAVP